ncbi:MAG: hypothetical protein M0T85_01800 [Dehalococcoidales bacterium]|nr:hypothetical protein [Dehalococcoidales bacterium]
MATAAQKLEQSTVSDVALIKPFEFDDPFTGNKIKISVSPQYSVLSIDDRCYYFVRETGEFDGVSRPMGEAKQH